MSVHGLKSLGILVVALVSFTYLLIAYSAVSALPNNPIRLPFEEYVRAVRWLPQGWKFFTRNPREEVLYYYARETNGRWYSISLGPLSKSQNLFGVDRRPRAQSVESAMLLAEVPKNSWSECKVEPEKCIEGLPVTMEVKNKSGNPTLKGLIAFVWREPLPWAWLPSKERAIMPSRVLKLYVE